MEVNKIIWVQIKNKYSESYKICMRNEKKNEKQEVLKFTLTLHILTKQNNKLMQKPLGHWSWISAS